VPVGLTVRRRFGRDSNLGLKRTTVAEFAAGSGTASVCVPSLKIDAVEGLCWAACIAMVATYYRGATDICAVKSARAGVDCCRSPTNVCEYGCFAEEVAGLFGSQPWSIFAKRNPIAVSWQRIFLELSAGRPVEAAITWDDGVAHAVLIVGCCEPDVLIVRDPGSLLGNALGPMTHAYLEGGMGYHGSWADSWTMIAPM